MVAWTTDFVARARAIVELRAKAARRNKRWQRWLRCSRACISGRLFAEERLSPEQTMLDAALACNPRYSPWQPWEPSRWPEWVMVAAGHGRWVDKWWCASEGQEHQVVRAYLRSPEWQALPFQDPPGIEARLAADVLDEDSKHDLLHALGHPRGTLGWRNYFSADVGTTAFDRWTAMVRSGIATRFRDTNEGQSAVFLVTDFGKLVGSVARG